MKVILLTLPLLMCAACNKEPSVKVENASVEDLAREVKESGLAENVMKPGKWEYTMSVVDMSAPGMPPQATEQMKRVMGHNRVIDKCVTEADVKKIDAAMGEMPKNCTVDSYEAGGGKVAGQMTCKNAGMTQKIAMNGTYTADSSDMTSTSEATGGAGPMGSMKITMNMKGRRIGDCA